MSLIDWLMGRRPGVTQKQQRAQEGASTSESEGQLIVIDGRQVLINVPYALPKDMQESNRLDFQHFMLRTVLGANYLAPLQNPQAILDVGSGSGRWMIEVAQAFPEASVLGCDLLEQKSEENQIQPANAQFMQADILKGLPFPDSHFDYVHQRLLFLAIPTISWPGVIRELVRVTRPGGWIELVETQFHMKNLGPASAQLLSWVVEMTRKRGINAWEAPDLKKEMQIAGLTNITQHQLDLPVGKWGGHIGSMLFTDGFSVMDAMKPLVTARLGIDPAEYDRVREQGNQESEHYHTEMTFFVVYGQRPPA